METERGREIKINQAACHFYDFIKKKDGEHAVGKSWGLGVCRDNERVSEEKLGIVYEHEWGAKCTQVVVMISSFIECTESHDEI